jgi:hypothetical protein
MSFTTPTVDVYVPGTTLGIGNVNAGTINIGKAGTTINVGGSMNVTNNVSTPSCTMTSLTTGNLIISPFSGDVAFNNFSARNATITNGIIANASVNILNSSTMLIGPYPVSGSFTNVNISNATIGNGLISNLRSTNMSVLSANMTYVNVSGLLINPLPSYPRFTKINTPFIDVDTGGTLELGNVSASAVYIGSSGKINVINNIGTGSGTGIINIGNDTNSIQLRGETTLTKPLTLGLKPTTALTVLGGSIKYTFSASADTGGAVTAPSSTTFGSFTNVPVGIYLFTLGTFTIFSIDPTDRVDITFSAATNITFISSSSSMQFGGNAATKLGIAFTIPISVNSAINQLTVTGAAFFGNFDYTSGSSSLLRIA